MSSGADNLVLTATGADAMQAETYFTFQNTGNVSTLNLLSNQDTGDLFKIATTTHGATTITTIDDDAAAGDLTLDIDGDITLDAAGENITARSNQFNFDSTNTEDPLVIIKNTTDDATSGRLRF